MASAKEKYSAAEFKKEVLDAEMGKSKNLRKMSPLRMISAGGFVAVSVFGNRSSTEDIDYILDPELKDLPKAEKKLSIAIEEAADQLRIGKNWINDSMAVFTVGENRKTLFRQSIQQNEILFQGKHIIIYAVKWQWALTRKLIRLGSNVKGDRDPDIDLSDSVALARRIVQQNGAPLKRDVIKGWTENIYTPIEDKVLDQVAAEYVRKYGTQGII
ncbi:hypothetical protein D6D02_07018 [Aureobasidium pullulans]|uniref:DUF7582 domain-containing protein n=1 Tax=Aureobasidium pullulans TaxID=5580 RepID=A0A4S8XA55_AURPU|nr:hypothetical protein D6D23_04591 [Aureobasidium pullulans]THW35121.1 hypothetical protein D6D22_08303 [Aureobasidium pullulans]THW58233.1 hypothetical protein D6D20_07380 [Aureobasidium pullulans]THX98313.1 hypothetical protein D6D03_07940 [Aureobasidium pullulans]THY08363.1 hypothetical protein D6D02_07018 [Aureobasidium pullulans]